MSLARVLASRLDRSFDLYRDFIDIIDEAALGKKLPGLPSNTIGLQLWCVVGARESYARAIGAGEWAGFSCTLDSPTEKVSVAEALHRSSGEWRDLFPGIDGFSEVQQGLLIDCLEHEATHQGQLIRYLYRLRREIPMSWRSRHGLAPLA